MAIYKRAFAFMMHHGDRAQHRLYADRKRELFTSVRGRVLEIGTGSGLNLAYMDRSVEWVGIDSNPHMIPYVKQHAEKAGIEADAIVARAEDLPFDAGTFDAVVCTLVLCSVDDVGQSISEVLRVLRPGGTFHFIEHVVATPERAVLRGCQRAIRPLWMAIADGCRPDRETFDAIHAGGFSSVDVAHFDVPPILSVIRPHIAGIAVK